MRDLPLSERPRERLLTHGAETLSNAELLAIIFGSGTKSESVITLSQRIASKYATLRALFAARVCELTKLTGISTVRFCQLQAVKELAKRYYQEPLRLIGKIKQSSDASQYIRAAIGGQEHETFAALLLNRRHHILHFKPLFHGSIAHTQVHPREVIKYALQHNAAAMIIAHNHPSDDCQPSMADQAMTQTLQRALNIMDIALLDHIIVGPNSSISFAELGLIS